MSGIPRYGIDYTSPIDAARIVAQDLVKLVWWKYGRSLDPVADLAQLKLISTRALEDRGSWMRELCPVRGAQRTYAWEPFSRKADDGDAVILPADRTPDLSGRWEAAPFFDPPGPFHRHFLQHVQIADDRIPPWTADSQRPSLLALCSTNLPAVFLCPRGSVVQDVPGQEQAMAERRWHRFVFKVITANLRGEPAARYGSPIPSEDAEESSAAEVIGRLQYLLRKHAQGLLDTPGVGVMHVGAHSPAGVFGPDLMLLDTLDLEVQVSSSVFLEAGEAFEVRGFDVQAQLEDAAGALQPVGTPRRTP